MKSVLLTLVFCAAALTASPAYSAVDSTVTGRWVATEGVAYAPWTFDFVAEGTKLTGTVSQGHSDGKGWSTGLTHPVAIADGRIEGNTITFNVLNPKASNRRINFKGRVENEQISFDREVVILGAGPLGRDGIFGKDGARQFVAKRVSSQLSLAKPDDPTPRVEGPTPRADGPRGWRARRNVSGRWIVQSVPNGPWTWDLRMSGRRVTGTVKQGSGETAPLEIFDGALDGPAVFFKVKSPDSGRTIRFTGMVNGEEMTILRVVEGTTGDAYGTLGVFSASAPSVVLARREPGTMISYPRGPGYRGYRGGQRPTTAQ